MTSIRNFAFLVFLLFSVGLIHAQTSIDITAQLTFTTLDVPGAGYTGLWSINKAGDIVGNYGQDTNGDSHGFLYSNGTFSYFDYPGESVTVPTGINDFGVIVGYAGQNPVVGFLYDGITFTNIRHGTDSATSVRGINNAGTVVGGTGTIYTTKGFQMQDRRFRAMNFPGQSVYAFANGINNNGQIVGYTDYDAYSYSHGVFKNIDFPGATQTEARGINDSGLIVGWYNLGSSYFYSFVLMKGKYRSFQYPGAKGTFADGVNASGQVVGQYSFDYQTWHGFVTSPITAADL